MHYTGIVGMGIKIMCNLGVCKLMYTQKCMKSFQYTGVTCVKNHNKFKMHNIIYCWCFIHEALNKAMYIYCSLSVECLKFVRVFC